MSAAKHTPGPWPLNIDTVHIRPGVDVQPVTHHMDAQGMADARLIAAAPDLLEELRLMVQQFAQYVPAAPNGGNEAWRMSKASAAIAKATGGVL